MYFDVYLPRPGGAADDFETVRVDADHWTNALKTGLAQIGGSAVGVEQAIATVREDGWLQVNEANGDRIFFVKEVGGAGPETSHRMDAAQEVEQPGDQDQTNVQGTTSGRAAVGQVVDRGSEQAAAAPQAVGTAPSEPSRFEGQLGVIEQAVASVARSAGVDVEAIASGALDLAIKYVPTEAGSVLYSHLNGQDLYFASARGPGAEKLHRMRIPKDKGIVGFCVMDGVCLGVTEVQKDPRFFGRVSASIGFDTRDILCAPVMADDVIYGAIELINKRGGSFDRNDLNVLSFIGFQLARQLKQHFR